MLHSCKTGKELGGFHHLAYYLLEQDEISSFIKTLAHYSISFIWRSFHERKEASEYPSLL